MWALRFMVVLLTVQFCDNYREVLGDHVFFIWLALITSIVVDYVTAFLKRGEKDA
jgi:hypothetical protein